MRERARVAREQARLMRELAARVLGESGAERRHPSPVPRQEP